MKKSMLYGGLLSILGTTVYADLNNQPAGNNLANPVQLAANAANIQLSAISGEQPAGAQVQQQPAVPASVTIKVPASQGPIIPDTKGTNLPASIGTPVLNAGSPATSATVAPNPQQLNCSYRIPAETKHVAQSLVLSWAEKATQQSFDFDHVNIMQQLTLLKPCYTEQGWQGFNDALQKSGNIKVIQSQLLTVSSMVDGKPGITELKENQWRISLPLQVVYRNSKEKLTQALTVDLIVGRKISGDLGIMQMIASPRHTSDAKSAETPQSPGIVTSTPPAEKNP